MKYCVLRNGKGGGPEYIEHVFWKDDDMKAFLEHPGSSGDVPVACWDLRKTHLGSDYLRAHNYFRGLKNGDLDPDDLPGSIPDMYWNFRLRQEDSQGE